MCSRESHSAWKKRPDIQVLVAWFLANISSACVSFKSSMLVILSIVSALCFGGIPAIPRPDLLVSWADLVSRKADIVRIVSIALFVHIGCFFRIVHIVTMYTLSTLLAMYGLYNVLKCTQRVRCMYCMRRMHACMHACMHGKQHYSCMNVYKCQRIHCKTCVHWRHCLQACNAHSDTRHAVNAYAYIAVFVLIA